MTKEEIKAQLLAFFNTKFELEFDGDDPDFNTDLYDDGHIDSLDSLVILTFIEKTFNFSVDAQDLIDKPMNSLNEMVDFIDYKLK